MWLFAAQLLYWNMTKKIEDRLREGQLKPTKKTPDQLTNHIMCNWIRTIEVCPKCDSKLKTSYAEFQCEYNCYPVRRNPFGCRSYKQISNEVIADSPCINCEEPISVFEDSNSSEDGQKTGMDSETVAVDDVSEDERDSDDGNMSDVSEVSALSDEDDQNHETIMEGLMAGQIQYDDDDTFDVQGFFGEPDLVEEESPVESPFLARIEMLRRGIEVISGENRF
ncbi:uncharacterized protein Bfra_000158 [Botrytis fragariae]|uniref:Uncharacterized protein n=1 Tax=Botrytis fragariae TaxID=1964551 RepID=A0A8H6B2T3_9HELO|nr:uncharacterized protein Bfra_000158 [Botrytis fragariae]KAF5877992.1 hypothetical protein Bfra_000158 [Botrytis fragariae]